MGEFLLEDKAPFIWGWGVGGGLAT